MSSDFYPLSSPRGRRSIQQINETLSITAENDQTAQAESESKGVCYFDNKVFSLRRINSNGVPAGYWLFKGNEPICCDSNMPLSLEKCDCFDKNNPDFRDCFQMGSYICTFPDGVIYETANTDEDVPVIKIEAEESEQSLVIQTVIKSNSDNDYTPIRIGTSYRIEDSQVQYYIQDESLWVNQNTFVMIYAKNKENTFDSFNEGDTISLKYSSIADLDIYTNAKLKSGILDKDKKEGSIRIIKKGKIAYSSALDISSNTDYIIASGHIHIFNSYQNSDYGDDRIEATFNNVTIKRKCPDIKYACECQNRIWACSNDGHEIFASALGDPYNFYDFSGLATDAYAVNVGTHGEFTACVNFLGMPHFFKENALHIISGNYPSNAGEMDGLSFSVSTVSNFRGVEKGSERSVAVIDNILYYKSSSGIVAFDGANTVVISDELGNVKYKNAVAGAHNNKYYVSMQDEKGDYHLFNYDTELGIWSREDNTRVLKFINAGSELLFLSADDSKFYSVSDEDVLENSEFKKEDSFEWMCETGDYGYSYPNNKYLSRFQIRMQIEEGASASFYIQYDSDGVWHRRGEMSKKGVNTFLLPIVPVRCDHMKIKIEGRGDVKLISISKILEEGGDV